MESVLICDHSQIGRAKIKKYLAKSAQDACRKKLSTGTESFEPFQQQLRGLAKIFLTQDKG